MVETEEMTGEHIIGVKIMTSLVVLHNLRTTEVNLRFITSDLLELLGAVDPHKIIAPIQIQTVLSH